MQTSYTEQRADTLYLGQLATKGSAYITEPLVASGAVRQVSTLTFAAGAAAVGPITITDEFGRTSTVSGASVNTSATTTATSAKGLLEDDDVFGSTVVITQAAGVLTLTAQRPGAAFTLTEGDANCTAATTTAAASAPSIPFGVFVADAGEGRCAQPSGSGDTILGVALRVRSLAQEETGLPSYPEGGVVTVYRGHDEIVVLCDDAADLAHGDAIFVRHAAGAGEVLGAVREDADTADAVELAGWVAVGAQFTASYNGTNYQAIRVKRI